MDASTKDDIKRIIGVIEKLQEKTTDNGCTEAEALIAAEKVFELLSKYNLDLTDADFNKDKISCVYMTFDNPNPKNRHAVTYCVVAIAELCNCVEFYNRKSNKFHFFGFPHDAKYAVFLMGFAYQYIESAVNKYKLTPAYVNRNVHGRKLVIRHSHGVAVGLSNKITSLMKKMKEEETSNCTQLVLRKKDKVDVEFNAVHTNKLTKGKSRQFDLDEAFVTGYEKGMSAEINKPIENEEYQERKKLA